jgi:hypothetical protein
MVFPLPMCSLGANFSKPTCPAEGQWRNESSGTAAPVGKIHKSFGKSARFCLWLPAQALEPRFHDCGSNIQGLLRLRRGLRLLPEEHGN